MTGSESRSTTRTEATDAGAATSDLDAPAARSGPDREHADGWRAPQHRDGMALVLSSGVSSAIGMLFWVLAARLFDQDTVGVNSAALSAVTLLASASHLNLGNAILRFVPVSERRRALVAGCFAVGLGWGAVVGLGFGIGANVWAPDLVAAFGHPALIAFYLISVPIWTVFVLQDSALPCSWRPPGWASRGALRDPERGHELRALGSAGAPQPRRAVRAPGRDQCGGHHQHCGPDPDGGHRGRGLGMADRPEHRRRRDPAAPLEGAAPRATSRSLISEIVERCRSVPPTPWSSAVATTA
jgi:hypothetical protein